MRIASWNIILLAAQMVASQNSSDAGSKVYTIEADGIKAQFIPYGATLTNLFVKGKDGKEVDVVLGYDDPTFYARDTSHPVYNSIPGRYTNRIGKGQFTIDGKTYHTERNDGPEDAKGVQANTLHSGTNNWSWRVWNVVATTKNSITFSLTDPAGSSMGMPGNVHCNVTYTVANKTWYTKMTATADAKTPLMLTQHAYFNLDAYKNPSTPTIFEHTLNMPYSKRYLDIDANALPTGPILTAADNTVNDFASRPNMTIGHARSSAAFNSNCGANCAGYNGFWLIENAPKDAVVLTLASAFSGVRARLRTNQVGIVLYSCAWSDGKTELKKTQGTAKNKSVEKSSCIAIEPQDYVDGINHPEWGRVDAQITAPGEVYDWEASWAFDTL